jgi:hypothetical protein
MLFAWAEDPAGLTFSILVSGISTFLPFFAMPAKLWLYL